MAYNINSDAEMLQQLMVKQMLDNAQKKKDFATTIGLRSNPPVKGDIPESYSAGGVSFKTPEGIKQGEESLKSKNAIELENKKLQNQLNLSQKTKESALPDFTVDEKNLFTHLTSMRNSLKNIRSIVPELPQYNMAGSLAEPATKFEEFLRVNSRLKPMMDDMESMKSKLTKLAEKGMLTQQDVVRNSRLIDTIKYGNPEEKMQAYDRLADNLDNQYQSIITGVQERTNALKAIHSGKKYFIQPTPKFSDKKPTKQPKSTGSEVEIEW